MLRAHSNCQASTIVEETGGGTFTCVQAEEGVGCAMVKWKLCGGNLRWLDLLGCTFTRLYHLSIFPSLSGTPYPLKCLTTLVSHSLRPKYRI